MQREMGLEKGDQALNYLCSVALFLRGMPMWHVGEAVSLTFCYLRIVWFMA